MQIVIRKHTLHFEIPFKVAYEEPSEPQIITVSLTDENGFRGLGSAAPDEEVTGETAERVFIELNKELKPSFFDEPLDYHRYHEKIQGIFAGCPSAQAAAEEAVLNLWCLQNKVSLGSLFGEARAQRPIMISIGIKGIGEMQKEIDQRLNQGFTDFKIKIGLNAKEDLARIRAAKKQLPAHCRILLDANQGYTFDEAWQFLKDVEGLGITLFEQPIAAEDIEGLKKLHHSTSIPIIADESVVSAEDALNLLGNDCVSGVNIKLMKCGGPINFLSIFHIAKSLNKIVMIGCTSESNISITTGAHLALALPIDFVDLDSGHMDFKDDPAEGGAIVENGMIRIGEPLKLKVYTPSPL